MSILRDVHVLSHTCGAVNFWRATIVFRSLQVLPPPFSLDSHRFGTRCEPPPDRTSADRPSRVSRQSRSYLVALFIWFIWFLWSIWFVWFLRFAWWVCQSGQQDRPNRPDQPDRPASPSLLTLYLSRFTPLPPVPLSSPSTPETRKTPSALFLHLIVGQTTQNPELITQNFSKRAG